MKKYFLHDGANQSGPFDIEELKSKNLTKTTPVWHEGLSTWTTVGEIEELKDIVHLTPPPLKMALPAFQQQTQFEIPVSNQPSYQSISTGKSKNKSVWPKLVMIVFSLFLVIVVIAMVVNYKDHGELGLPKNSTETYQEKVLTIEEMEKAEPAKFLSSDGKYMPTVFGKKFRLFGQVTNNATVANYKDVILKVNFYSATDALITSKEYVIYEYFPAHSTKQFEFKIERHGGSEKLGWSVTGATPY